MERRYTAKSGGKVYTVIASSENEALLLLIKQHRMDPRKLSYLKTEGVHRPIQIEDSSPKMMFVAQVGKKDYIVDAANELEALRALATLRVDMSKVRNLRRRR